MGWASGSELFGDLIPIVKKFIPDEKDRVKFYTKAIVAFEQHDWDTQGECIGADPAYDKALKKLHGDWEA